MNRCKIPVEEYAEMAATFDVSRFDAEAVALLAREAGMRYIVLCSA
jgi:alpha-L-fucosidase